MNRLSAEFIRRHAGDLDDADVARVQETGARGADLIEAVLALEGDGIATTTDAASAVYAILLAIEEADQIEELAHS